MATGTIKMLMPTDIGVVRPNLLDNWYFVGGGSQSGWGKFPINQRGQTSYTYGTTKTYGFDRWMNARGTASINNDGVLVVWDGENSSSVFFQQYVPLGTALNGKMLTASILFTDGTILAGTATQTSTGNAETTYINSGMHKIGVTTLSAGNYLFTYYCTSTSGKRIAAFKLELGSSQTLAHQENGTWVLNEVPDFAEQLTICRKYFRVLESSLGSGSGQYCVGVRGYNDATSIIIPLDEPMAKSITPSLPSEIQGAAVDMAGTSVGLSAVGSGSTKTFTIVASANLARGPIAVYLNSIIWLSAEL